ncbi:MAG: ribosome small subunit-dependent GTPase A [Candidatus Melainabacteria bacterium]|nr:ribosome small subunit-dependent GTPase A [Candidatus Melainabacteria bacterium]
MKLTGTITKILANFYYVVDEKNKTWECFARSRLLKEGKFLFVGDKVEFEETNPTSGVITNLIDRKNKIAKPPIANIDQVLIVFSTCEPDFGLYNLDRYISYIKYELPYEKTIVCINKTDLKEININDIYKNSGVEIFYASALTKNGLDLLAPNLVNKTTVLTGPSGTGKSSLIKALAPSQDILIGSLSAIKQGKHITRNIQLIPIEYKCNNGFLGDTPGFTQFSFAGLNPIKLQTTFNEFKNVKCNFNNCLHEQEEGCKINDAIEKDAILQSRYENYLMILSESRSKIFYRSKQEAKVKSVGGLKGDKKIIPKINQETRAKSRKKEKQELLKFKDQN